MGNRSSSSQRNGEGGGQSSSSAGGQQQQPPGNGINAGSTSYYTLIKNSYQQLVNAIIRPPRCEYNIDQLGPLEFDFCDKRFQRVDFQLTNPRGLRFVCSLWEPVEAERPSERLPCVIYMHGNSSARIEALSSLSMVLTMGATLLAFDFTGSGLSEGEYVSLGAYEKDDLQAAIEYLRNNSKTSTIALWGRSMGAATALLHAERDPSIASMVLDSAFSDLVVLAEDMVDKGRQQGIFAPSMLVKLAIKWIRSSVQKTANFDIKSLSPIETADKCFVPALFIAAESDNFVLPHHSQRLHEKYGGDKNLVMVEGDHNSPRPRYLFDSIAIFLQETLQIPPQWYLAGGEAFIRRLPWSYRQTRPFTQANNHTSSQKARPLVGTRVTPRHLDMSEVGDDDPDAESNRAALMAYMAQHQQLQQRSEEEMSADERMALTLLQEELEMQQGVQDSLFQLLSGGMQQSSAGTRAAPASASSTTSTNADTNSINSNSHSAVGPQTNHRRLSKPSPKPKLTLQDEDTMNFALPPAPEKTSSRSSDAAGLSPTAMLAAASLLSSDDRRAFFGSSFDETESIRAENVGGIKQQGSKEALLPPPSPGSMVSSKVSSKPPRAERDSSFHNVFDRVSDGQHLQQEIQQTQSHAGDLMMRPHPLLSKVQSEDSTGDDPQVDAADLMAFSTSFDREEASLINGKQKNQNGSSNMKG